MGFVKEFKEFALKGNMVDMAVGIIIGGAFGTVVKSLVEDVFMPPLGMLSGGIDFTAKSVELQAAAVDEAGKAVPAVLLKYGSFINNAISFVIVAFAVFLLVKGMNTLKKREEAKPAAPPAPSAEERLLGEIRDLLKQRA